MTRAEQPTLAGSRPHGLDVGTISHPGRVRTANEDRFLSAPERGLFAIADGMGGHGDGEIASAALVEALAAVAPAQTLSDLLARAQDAAGRANAALAALGARRGGTVGTTLAALLLGPGEMACLWSGDSRVYRVREGAVERLTRDHTEAQDLLDGGILSADEARHWPRRHVITRAVGAKPDLELAVQRGSRRPGDVFLLCSDGLTDQVEDSEILAQIGRGRSAQEICDGLLALTLARGASDNVTIVTVRTGVAPSAGAGA